MTRLILQIFEVLKANALLRWASLVVLTALLGLLLTGQSYKEDISDFLPLDDSQQQAFQTFQNTSTARRVYVIFQNSDHAPQALDLFCELLAKADTAQVLNYLTADDPEVMQEGMNAIYARIPYLLTAADYARIDSLTATPDFITQQLENDKQMLMLPTAGMLDQQIRHDPLNLFTPVIERLRPAMDANRQMLLIDSPYGASETEHNAQLVAQLQQVCDSVGSAYADVSVHLTGGPVIAVGNARQIKTDSMMAIAIAVVLIFLLLWLAFRNVRNLLLIAFSIGWGWLFAMGCLTLVHNDVSIIIIGISSVILGIAVNYPLHLIAHLSHAADIRSALKEIVMPLVIGNITTVGAFLALVPLESVALRDLGLFSAFLLMGTILFVLLWLPHMVHHRAPQTTARNIFSRIGEVKLENKTWIVSMVVLLTFVLGYFSLQTSFDADLRNINYMTAEQKQDMQYLEQTVNFKSPDADLSLWNEWRTNKGAALCRQLEEQASEAGFSEGSFDAFHALVAAAPADESTSLTAAIINNLSDNFNYIGWACGFIVFFFLWFSLGSIELALLSFLPMAVSWVWILGIMSLLGIQFNVVNIILATFIFGQGDDYTIFMTEGCQYEYAYRRRMLSSYKQSIIISALIMFIGIGALIIAKHPALFALAEVTIIGMFSVVLMAYLFPPLIFRWLVYSQGKERLRPLTIRQLFKREPQPTDWIADCYRYRGTEISTAVNRRLRRYRNKGLFQKIDEQLLPQTKTVVLINSGWGEIALYEALRKPDIQFIAVEKDSDKTCVASHVAEGRAANLTCLEAWHGEASQAGNQEIQTIVLP
jgi:predicted exporter